LNWFDVLKEQRQVAQTIQSFRPIEVDKPFTIDEPEKDCYEKLFEHLASLFPRKEANEEVHPYTTFSQGDYESSNYATLTAPSRWSKKFSINPKTIDDEYCYVLEHFKSMDLNELISEFDLEKKYKDYWRQAKKKKIGSNVTFKYYVRPERRIEVRGWTLPNASHELVFTYYFENDITNILLRGVVFFDPEDLK